MDRKEAAREGLIKAGQETDLGETALWTRVNALDSPWVLDDLTHLVAEIGDKLDVIMVPKVEGPWDIHYVDRLLAQLESSNGIQKPLLIHAILETALGVAQPGGDRHRLAAHAGHELRPGRPGRLAADEDHPRRRRPPRLPRDRGPRAGERGRPAPVLPAGPVALLDRPHGRRLHARPGSCPSTAPTATSRTSRAARPSSASAFLLGCVGAWSLHPAQIDIAKKVFSPDPEEVKFAKKVIEAIPDGARRAHDRRQDAGRRHLEAVQGDGRPWPSCWPRRTRSWPRPTR